jgi:hypothetical protein
MSSVSDKASVDPVEMTKVLEMYEFGRSVHPSANTPACKLLDDAKSQLMVAVNSMYAGKGLPALKHMTITVFGSDISKELMLAVAADPVKFYLAGGSACKQVLSITSDQWDTWSRDLSLWHKLCCAPAIMKDGVLNSCTHCYILQL